MKKLAISAVGKDQPGIVAAFTKVLYETGCNVEDTNMTILEDQFTMMFILHARPDLDLNQLKARLQEETETFHLQLDIHPIETDVELLGTTGAPWMISVSGPDQTGIMYHVTQYLASRNVNIRHLSSKRLSHGPEEPLFLMALEVDVPLQMTGRQLQDELADLARAEGLEIHAEPLEVYTL